eukprot:6710428-Pyramimonas_sp.AAC.1
MRSFALSGDAQLRPFRGRHWRPRHYSGEGVWAYSVLIHSAARPRVRGIEVRDRSFRIDVATRGPDSKE